MKTKNLFKNCTRKSFLLVALMLTTIVSGCSNDDDHETSKFPDGVEPVLTAIKGTFIGEEYSLEQWFRTDKLTFSPFELPIKKTTFKDGTVEIYGTIHRVQNKVVGGEVIDDYFFHINPLKEVIVMYGYNKENETLNEKKETLSYKIEDNSTIKLKDYGLTEDNWIIYSRQ